MARHHWNREGAVAYARCKAYQEKLEVIRQRALATIEERARLSGANAVLGTRLDFDEISGAGKSMLMLTALGTAVTLRYVDSGGASDAATAVAGEDVRNAGKTRQCLAEAARGELAWTDAVWRFLVEQRVAEAVPFAIAEVERDLAKQVVTEQTQQNQAYASQLLLSVDPKITTDELYAAIQANGLAADFAVKLLVGSDLFDPGAVESLLDSDSFDVRRRAIQTLGGHARTYSPGDMERMQSLAEAIGGAFREIASYFEKKKVIGGTVRAWKCGICGNEVEASHNRCQACLRDTWGFGADEITPSRAVEILEERIGALRELFGEATAPATAS